MISKIWKELQKRKDDNKGAALVMVIIAIAFVGMLVAMILYMAYCNYLMKASEVKAKRNFYSAEYALDVINAGLQLDISECMSEAYVKTMNNSSGKDAEVMELEFRTEYIQKIKSRLQDRSGGVVNDAKWDLDHLKSFWTNASVSIAATAGSTGAYLGINGASTDNDMTVASNADYITLSNVRVVYTDSNGYVSIINTDIRVKVPTIGFAQSATKLELERFSLIANNSLVNNNLNTDPVPDGVSVTKGSNVTITGNVFGGYQGVSTGDQAMTRFEKDSKDNAPGVIYSYNLIADSLNANNALDSGTGIFVDESFVTYVNDINIETARLDLDGKAYVGDDMDISGKGSEVTLRGEYYGYGNTLGQAEGSSSILVNGGNTTLDFGDLNKLLLSGHAYVGAKKYDADKDRFIFGSDWQGQTPPASDKIEDMNAYEEKLNATGSPYAVSGNTTVPENTIPKNEMDVMMGESISVKANQLLYMVPAECIGYKKATGEQEIAKNPMTYDEYKKLTDTVTDVPQKDASGNEVKDEDGNVVMEKAYDPVRLDKLWAKLGGVAYTNDYRAVYRRVNGTVLVYLYLDFGVSEIMANEFYKAYYEYDKTGVDKYVNSYISRMDWNNALNSNLTLAGNAFRLGADKTVEFIDDDLNDPDQYANILDLQDQYSAIYNSLMHSLSTQAEKMTSTQQTSEIFDSLVDMNKLLELKGKDLTNGTTKARIINGDVVYPSSACPAETSLIVASGNIYITGNYEGLAIAKGNIYICDGCSKVNYDPVKVLNAMRAKYVDGVTGKEMFAYEVFGVNGTVSYAIGGSNIPEEKVELSDLIVYQNWKKE